MLIPTPPLAAETRRRLSELDELRASLGSQARRHVRWMGTLRRFVRARTAEGSVSIEGFHVGEDEALALSSGAASVDPDNEDGLALDGYARAMDHVAAMADDPHFGWSERAMLDLHFDACSFQRDCRPGRWRTGPVRIVADDGSTAYQAPEAADVPALMAEVVEWLERGDLETHVAVRAAMAHLHLISVHPFKDGNGRVSRIVQSLVLARDGLVSPEFGSIEEYLAENTPAYYAALQDGHGPSYEPADSDASGWIDFCLDAHVKLARRRLSQIEEAGSRWARIETLIEEKSWPDRLAIALEQGLVGGSDRGAYCAEADVSAPTASGDFRRLVDAGLLVQEGRGRMTRYLASEALRALATGAADDGP